MGIKMNKSPNILEEFKKANVSKELIQKQTTVENAVQIFEEYIEDSNYFTHPSMMLAKIEPIALKKPTQLFGSRINSPIINKFTLRAALISKEDRTKYIPGNLVMEAYISEDALSKSLVNTNAESFPATMIKALGENVSETDFQPIPVEEKNKNRFNESISNTYGYVKENIEKIKEVLNEKGKKLSKKEAQQILKTLNIQIGNFYSNTNYHIEESVTDYQKDISSVLTEADNMIKRLSFYSGMSKEQDLIEDKTKQNNPNNPLRVVANGIYTNEERKEIYEKVKPFNLEEVKGNRDSFKYFNNFVESYKNPHILKTKYHEANLSFRFSKITSNVLLPFSTVKDNSNNYMKIEFSSGYIEDQNEDSRIYSGANLCRMLFSTSDFLMLIRGNKETDYVPCSMSSFCSNAINEDNSFISKEEIETEKDKVYAPETTKNKLAKVNSLVSEGIKTEKAKQEIQEAINSLEEEIEQEINTFESAFDSASEKVKSMANERYHNLLNKMDKIQELKNFQSLIGIEKNEG